MPTEMLLCKRALMAIVVTLSLAALAITAIGTWTDIDVSLANALYDQATRKFPWHHRWFAERFSHEIVKTILTVAALAIIVVVVWDIWRPLLRWTPLQRLQARVLAVSAIAVPVVISTLKQRSASHCPWDLSMYGGAEPYVRLLDALPAGVNAGHCLPAGHASSALWLVAIGVFWLPSRPRMALLMSSAGLSLGAALGWIQQMRGAHFLTHTLWSIWIACGVVLVVAVLLPRLRRRPNTLP